MFNQKDTKEDCINLIELSGLNSSFNLLRTTALELSQTAAETVKILENKVKDTEERFTHTIDMLPDLIIIKDGVGRWKSLNKFGQDLYGWHQQEYLDKTDHELALKYPEFRGTLFASEEIDSLVWEFGKSYRLDRSIPKGDTIFIFDVIKTPIFYADGSRKELIIVGRDITDIVEKRRRTNACFYALNSISDCVAILDKDGKIFFVNDPFLEAFNFSSHEEVVGVVFRTIINIPCFDIMWAAVKSNRPWHNLGGGCPNSSIPCNNMCILYNFNVLPMMNGLAEPVYYICTFKLKQINRQEEHGDNK